MKGMISDHEYQKHARTNAKHRVDIHASNGNPAKTAEALLDLPFSEAITHAYHKALKHRQRGEFHKAKTVLEAAASLPRETKEEPVEHWHQYRRHCPVIKRNKPGDILCSEI